jgi:hypothetical protein
MQKNSGKNCTFIRALVFFLGHFKIFLVCYSKCQGEAGAYLGFCQGGCTFLADLPPPPPDLDLDPDLDPHQDFELDPDPDPHHNNADPHSTALGSTVKRLLSNL